MATEFRAHLDAEITFRNGGSLSTRDFRLDVPDPLISQDALATLLVGHLGLLMVDRVELSNVRIVEEPHKGSRGVTPSATAAPAAYDVIDLTHPIEPGMITYPGLPGPEITDHMSWEQSREHYAPGTEFHIAKISMVANTGTYLDAPAHRHRGADDLAALPLDRTAAVPGLLVDVTGSDRPGVDRLALAPYDVRGRAVLIRTGWDRHWRTPEYGGADAPFLTPDAAAWLVDAGATLVGIDSVNIDSVKDPQRPAHTLLLAAGIPVLEHLRGLDRLPAQDFRLHAAPVPVRGMATFPVRAYAVVEG
jgi:kynurenine formamidase